MKKYSIYLFQNYLRSHVLNFGLLLKQCQFYYKPDNPTPPPSKAQRARGTAKQFSIKKTDSIAYIRRIIGLPNIRIRLINKYDALFTNGCLLITNKPYCVYVENGVALFNYDLLIAKNPIAKIIFKIAIRMENCKKIIFMSEAAEKSFYGTLRISPKYKSILHSKTTTCYPLVKNPTKIEASRKSSPDKCIKFLFAGAFYIKGGLEIINTFSKLSAIYPDIKLTIVTETASIKPCDIKHINKISSITLINATLSEVEMFNLYNSNHVFLFPTFRDSLGVVLIEALSAGMPIIANDQFATSEMVIDEYNGFLFPNHPLKDYNPETYEMYGRLSEPVDFYNLLFEMQKTGKTKPVENFLYTSMEKLIIKPELIEKFSNNSLELYNKKFHYQLLSDKIESVFLEAIKK